MARHLVEVDFAGAIRFCNQGARPFIGQVLIDVHQPLHAKGFGRVTEDAEHAAVARQHENSGPTDDDAIFLAGNPLENLRLLLKQFAIAEISEWWRSVRGFRRSK